MNLTFGEVETFVSDLECSEIFYHDIVGLNLKQKGKEMPWVPPPQ